MMNSNQIRKAFLDFFESKQHKIVPSAPMVVKNDPTLMFTNAGMNQFKDLFLGNSPIVYSRIADSQKCLRVSGKHNDLEEVGHDTYHHTMFEMLGNWSFGDYFKKDAIDWAWEFLTKVMKINPERLYATVFEGNAEENIEQDTEAKSYWAKYLPESRILLGNKKDNFWEMGETGPCGPCSEVHVDIRSEEERKKTDGALLVNKSDPHVIEIWNLVFIQFNRKADGSLEQLPAKHVDTGMGFERLCMVVQGKQSNYDSDVFQPIINEIGRLANLKYGVNNEADIAMRVIADHLRTISFSIADGQLPSNAKAGYVIRRILRRAVRYAYTFLKQDQPFMYKLLPVLIEVMGNAYPELKAQRDIIEKVIIEEEHSFLRTLETGIKLLDKIIEKHKEQDLNIIDGKSAFKLYDTYGFPPDLTELILREKNMQMNKVEFDAEMQKQHDASSANAQVEATDWITTGHDEAAEFVGYDLTESFVNITRYRKVKTKGKEFYHIVLNKTPFYAESGGQVGDKGYLEHNGKQFAITDTHKENNLTIHYSDIIPEDISATFKAVVNISERRQTQCNHSATHLLHEALRETLGTHVEQKGSLVEPSRLRFDFSHFQKLTEEEILRVENIVNEKIRTNYKLEEFRTLPIEDAQKMGAMALFGEKYGETVRVIKFGKSVELCGGTHVASTGQIGIFKIISEGAIAAGIRRIEAITAGEAEKFFQEKLDTLKEINLIFKNPKNVLVNIQNLVDENNALKKQIERFNKEKVKLVKTELLTKKDLFNGVSIFSSKTDLDSASVKDLAFQLKAEITDCVAVFGSGSDGKANLTVMISDNLVNTKKLNANTIIREAAKEINGGGGGQAFYATAGGKDIQKLDLAINKAIELIKNNL